MPPPIPPDGRSDVERYGCRLTKRQLGELRDPDRSPSFSRIEYVEKSSVELCIAVEVRGHGVLWLLAGPDKNDLAAAAFTSEEIQFNDAIDRSFDEARRARARRRNDGDPPDDQR